MKFLKINSHVPFKMKVAREKGGVEIGRRMSETGMKYSGVPHMEIIGERHCLLGRNRWVVVWGRGFHSRTASPGLTVDQTTREPVSAEDLQPLPEEAPPLGGVGTLLRRMTLEAGCHFPLDTCSCARCLGRLPKPLAWPNYLRGCQAAGVSLRVSSILSG